MWTPGRAASPSRSVRDRPVYLLVLADGHSEASLVLALFVLRDMMGQDGKGTKTRQFP
jgi:hypothetical protein